MGVRVSRIEQTSKDGYTDTIKYAKAEDCCHGIYEYGDNTFEGGWKYCPWCGKEIVILKEPKY